VFTNPTLVQAYTGMESAAYSLCFLLGLWLYGSPRSRLLATAVFAFCVWLRPEFLVMLPLICLERAVTARRTRERCLTRFLGDVWPHFVIWGIMVAAYMSYNWHQDGHLVPNTFEAKAVAPGSVRPAWLDGLPAALKRGNPLCILLSIVFWPTLVLFLAGAGLALNCAPLAFGARETLLALWRDKGPAASARRLAVITLIGYPWLRGFVDSGGLLVFQFQRYYAHLTPLSILAAIGALPVTGALVKRRFWNWSDTPLDFQRNRTFRWAMACFLVMGTLGVIAVGNIDSMQVRMGHWVEDHTTPDQVVATNDIGAIGFISRRPILDTVGLIEPDLVTHYKQGGKLLEYLQKKNPAYVILFPWWYPELRDRSDVLEPVHSITLSCNVICGGSNLVVYKPKWGRSVGKMASAPP
jgi:hypothetical protein